MNYRLLWGQADTLTLIPSSLDVDAIGVSSKPVTRGPNGELPPIPPEAPTHFVADTPPELYFIAMNDWPYSGSSHPSPHALALTSAPGLPIVPSEVEHSLVWTRLPIYPPTLPPPSETALSARLHQDGLWGFTGIPGGAPPPSPSLLPECLPALAEWGVTMDKLVRSPRGTDEEEAAVRAFGHEIAEFIRRRWTEREWETAWFVNPPVSGFMSLPLLDECMGVGTAMPVSLRVLTSPTEAAERARLIAYPRFRSSQDTRRDCRSRVKSCRPFLDNIHLDEIDELGRRFVVLVYML